MLYIKQFIFIISVFNLILIKYNKYANNINNIFFIDFKYSLFIYINKNNKISKV